jgi:hypothetical protein
MMLSRLWREPREERPWRPGRYKRPGDTTSLNAGRRWSNPRDTAVSQFEAGVPCRFCSQALLVPQPKGNCLLPFAAVPLLRLESRSAVAVLQEQH